MATELFSLWGFQTGWRSQHSDGYHVSGTLDGLDVWYVAPDVETVEKAFSRACRRTFFRRYLPCISAPPKELERSAQPHIRDK